MPTATAAATTISATATATATAAVPTTAAAVRPRRAVARRLLRSPVVDLLLGPHGVDRYLELVAPTGTVRDARAEVVAVRHQTGRSVTLTLRPNAAFTGASAGQFVRVGVEIDGVRRTRTYSPAGGEGDRTLELTVTEHPAGLVSSHLVRHARAGLVVHLGTAQGEFMLPRPRPARLIAISGGSGITPVLAMARTLAAERHAGAVRFLHYARTEADWLYADEARALGVDAVYRTTRGLGGERLDAAALGPAVDAGTWAAVCGPPALLDAARTAWAQRGGRPEQLLSETFTPPSRLEVGDAAQGTVRFLRSDRRTAIGDGTLLEQAEAAGLSPAFGCRMGICHTCTCRKAAGVVRNLRTGVVSAEEDEDIQLCVSVPAGDVALEL